MISDQRASSILHSYRNTAMLADDQSQCTGAGTHDAAPSALFIPNSVISSSFTVMASSLCTLFLSNLAQAALYDRDLKAGIYVGASGIIVVGSLMGWIMLEITMKSED